MVETQEEVVPSNCKAPEKYDKYVFKLSDKYKKIAKKELREDKSSREQSLAQLREWIAKHPNIKRCRTDSIFLLRFLRTKKFSVPQACDMLEKYLTIHQLYPNWFKNFDILDPEMEAIIDSGYIVPLPEKDEEGRQMILSVAGALNLERVTSALIIKVHTLTCEVLADDEEAQICGYTHLIDDTHLSMKLMSLWSVTDIKNLMGCIQNSLPIRQKENHFIGLNSSAAKFIEFCCSLLSHKLQKRVILHKSVADLRTKINPKLLPKEYGGTIPMAVLIRNFKEKIRSQRSKLLALDEMCIQISKNSMWIDSCRADMDNGIIGSFKKLEVD